MVYIGPKRSPSRAEDATTLQRDDRTNRYLYTREPTRMGQTFLHAGRWHPLGAARRFIGAIHQAFAERNHLANLSRKFRSLAPPMFRLRSLASRFCGKWIVDRVDKACLGN